MTGKKRLSKLTKREILGGIIGIIVIICALVSVIVVHVLSRSTKNTVKDNSNSGSKGTILIQSGDLTTSGRSNQLPQCTSYQTIDNQAWLEIVKDPDGHRGECVTVYGEVTQFDSSTGNASFRANVGGVQQTPSYGFVNYPSNTILTGDTNTLTSVVNQNLFTASVMVLGSYSYQTQIGGQTTVPQLQVNTIQVTGSLSN